MGQRYEWPIQQKMPKGCSAPRFIYFLTEICVTMTEAIADENFFSLLLLWTNLIL